MTKAKKKKKIREDFITDSSKLSRYLLRPYFTLDVLLRNGLHVL